LPAYKNSYNYFVFSIAQPDLKLIAQNIFNLESLFIQVRMRVSDLEWLRVDFAAGHEELEQVAIGFDMQILQGL
jgi:hypothetical protein